MAGKIRGFVKALIDKVQSTGAVLGLSKTYNDIFELDGVPEFREFYTNGINVWRKIFRGFYEPWHIVRAPTIDKPDGKRNMERTDFAKASCAEIAGLIWTESCDINVNALGFEPDEKTKRDMLGEFIHDVLWRNKFDTRVQEFIERSLALGGGAFKVWYEPKRDKAGNERPSEGKIRIDYCKANQFIPLSWDNADVHEGVFVSRLSRGDYYYTRLEWHRWDGDDYIITNELYRADKKNAAGQPQDILGSKYPLNEIYPYLDESVTLKNIDRPLFAYFAPPIANNIDDDVPLGISLYANALGTLHALDVCFDSFMREFKLGKKRIIVPASCIRVVTDPQSGDQLRYFDASDEVYEAINTDDRENLKISDNTVELRVEEHVAALNALLCIYCMQTGLSPNTFTFDPKTGVKTATEVISENSKTYKTIKCIQNILKDVIEQLIYNILSVAQLYGVTWNGTSVESLVSGGYECNIAFDDGIIQDRRTNIDEGLSLVGAGLLSKKSFLIDPKYGQGLTPEQAEAELAQINNERMMINDINVGNIMPID